MGISEKQINLWMMELIKRKKLLQTYLQEIKL